MGYYIRFRRGTLYWPDSGSRDAVKGRLFLRFVFVSIVVVAASLSGVYLLLKSLWELGIVVLLLSAFLSIGQVKWLSLIAKDKNAGKKNKGTIKDTAS